jgi:hypothetical protein
MPCSSPRTRFIRLPQRSRHVHDLPDDWLNDGVKGFLPGDDPQARPVFESEALRVDVASPRYLLAMKLLAAREQDVEDIVLLYPVVWLHERYRGSGSRGVRVPREGDRAKGSVSPRGVLRFDRPLDRITRHELIVSAEVSHG